MMWHDTGWILGRERAKGVGPAKKPARVVPVDSGRVAGQQFPGPGKRRNDAGCRYLLAGGGGGNFAMVGSFCLVQAVGDERPDVSDFSQA